MRRHPSIVLSAPDVIFPVCVQVSAPAASATFGPTMAAAAAAVLAHENGMQMLSMTPPRSAEPENDPAVGDPSAELPSGAGDKPNGGATTTLVPTRKHFNAAEVDGLTVNELEQRMELLRQLYQRHLKELGRFTPEPEEIDANAAKPVRAAAEASKQAAADAEKKTRAKLEEVVGHGYPILFNPFWPVTALEV